MIRPLPQLLSKRSDVTIGIGLVCSSNPKPTFIRPDTLVLMADTMGSTDTGSTPELHKLYIEENLYVACAGNVEIASEVTSIFKQEMSKIPIESRMSGHVWDALNFAVHQVRIMHFKWDVLAPKYMFTTGEMFEGDHQNAVNDWQQYDLGVELLVGTFHRSGIALLYYVGKLEGNYGSVFPCQFPGYWAIGAGKYNAMSWLNFRHQQLGLHPRQSSFHAYEAKVMANMAPTVNENVDMVIAFADKHYILTTREPERDGCPISLKELKEMYKKYGPQDTNPLGHVPSRPSTSRK